MVTLDVGGSSGYHGSFTYLLDSTLKSMVPWTLGQYKEVNVSLENFPSTMYLKTGFIWDVTQVTQVLVPDTNKRVEGVHINPIYIWIINRLWNVTKDL